MGFYDVFTHEISFLSCNFTQIFYLIFIYLKTKQNQEQNQNKKTS